MGRIFGTDGVRGIANERLDVELALAISRAAGTIIKQDGNNRPRILVGRDTRLSGEMLESAVAAGLASVGCDVELLGVVPTPAVAYLVKELAADGGVMITASHNPYMYNGIKYFGSTGFKLTDEQEERIEAMVLDGREPMALAFGGEIGRVAENRCAVEKYIDHIASAVGSLEGLRIAVDCANGAASAVAERVFAKTGAAAAFINREPNGVNVNENCGSLHIEALGKFVKENGFDLGVAFDGDADRCLCVNENGEVVDGDFIMAICARDMLRRGKLARKTVVGTIMANMGFSKFCEENGINFIPTKVGDRYVLEEMEMEGYCFGGEQSGHVIFRDFATTGDGQLTAVQLLAHLKQENLTLAEAAKVMKRYPQTMINVNVSHDGKLAFYMDAEVKRAIEEGKARLAENGRVVARVSGTEPLIRIMVEGLDETLIQEVAEQIAGVVRARLA